MARPKPKRIALSVLGALLAFVAVLSIRAATVRSRQPNVAPLSDAPVDPQALAGHLAKAVARKTVSEPLPKRDDPNAEWPPVSPELAAAFEGLHGDLAAAFPKVHATLKKEVVGGHALLFTWEGSDPKLAPIVLCGHMDVVPVEPGTEKGWTHDAFSGQVEAGFVWGRGTLDDKVSVVGELAAVEALIGEGFRPTRTVYLAFGEDEEISGVRGAAKIVSLLASRNVKPEFVLDEGNPIVVGMVPGIAGAVAPIGIAEKGYVSVDLSVEMPGGHSSIPAPESAIDVLARGVERLRAEPMPAHLDGALAQFLGWAAPEMGFKERLILTNTWVTAPLVERIFSGAPTTNATIRTTMAVTILKAGVKDNVIPQQAGAVVNYRVMPGDTTDGIVALTKEKIGDGRVKVVPRAEGRSEPGPVASVESRAFGVLASTVREVFPGTVVAPSLFLGATDGRLYAPIAKDIYRFLPVVFQPADLDRLHGTNERIGVTAFGDAVRFYRRLVRQLAAS